MTSTAQSRVTDRDTTVDVDRDGPTAQETRAARVVAGLTRIALSTIFLWAFFDKLLGLGHETESGKGWVDGASPTAGFLTFAAKGPFKGLYNSIGGAAWADWLFMAALLGIGVALLLGIAMRITAVAGTALMLMMWSAVLPPENHLFMDDHIIYALVLIGLALTRGGHPLGLGGMWQRLPLVRKNPVLL